MKKKIFFEKKKLYKAVRKFDKVFNTELMPKIASHHPSARSGDQFKISELFNYSSTLKSETILFNRWKVTNYQRRKIYQNFISCTVKKKLENN